MRDVIENCTGSGGLSVEDDRDYCLGWVPYIEGDDQECYEQDEYRYTTSDELDSTPTSAGISDYSGGGYVLKLKGFIGEVEERVQLLKDNAWINNRTRAVMVEFAVYNAQVSSYIISTY